MFLFMKILFKLNLVYVIHFLFQQYKSQIVLVCTSHKEPILVSDFDLLYLKSYFEFFKSVKSIL